MKKGIMKRGLAYVLSVIICVGIIAALPANTASAASYPTCIANNSSLVASVGDTVPIIFKYIPAYNNEEIIVDLYNSNGSKVGSTSRAFSNANSSSFNNYTVNWDTTGKAAGKYEVVVTKKFYSFFRWNEAPTKSTSYITLYDDLSSKNDNNLYSEKEYISSIAADEYQASENDITTAFSAWDKIITDDYTMSLSEMYLGASAEAIAVEENMFNPKENSELQWILMKFDVTNKSTQSIAANEIIGAPGCYKYTGNPMTVASTASFTDDRLEHSYYRLTLQPGETNYVWFGVYVPKTQGMPYLKLDVNGKACYLNTNPAYVYTEKTEEDTPAVDNDDTDSSAKILAKGKSFESGSLKYKVTTAAKESDLNGKVSVVGLSSGTSVSKLTIPDTVEYEGVTYEITSIAKAAFKGNKKLTSLVVGDNVETISKTAFYGCTKLKTVTLGTSLKTIGAKAFYNCKKLTKLNINSDDLTKAAVGGSAFKKTSKKCVVTVPESSLSAYSSLLVSKGVNKKAKIQAADTNSTTDSEADTSSSNSDDRNLLLYEDSKIKIYFKGITAKGVELDVENLTDVCLTIQADSVSINGKSTENIVMSDEVAPQSIGTVLARCSDFAVDTKVGTFSGQFRVIDFDNRSDSYDALINNVVIDKSVSVSVKASGTLLYEDSKVKIYYKEITEKGVVFEVENLTDINITIQAESISVNKRSINRITMSDDVAPHSIGDVIAKCTPEYSGEVTTIGGQLKVIDFNTRESYKVTFVNVPIE